MPGHFPVTLPDCGLAISPWWEENPGFELMFFFNIFFFPIDFSTISGESIGISNMTLIFWWSPPEIREIQGFKDFMVFINTIVTRYLAHSCVFLAFLATAYDTDAWFAEGDTATPIDILWERHGKANFQSTWELCCSFFEAPLGSDSWRGKSTLASEQVCGRRSASCKVWIPRSNNSQFMAFS